MSAHDALTHGGGAIDPVCGMQVAGDTPFRTEHEGHTLLFCSERCRARFAASPQTFLVAPPAAHAPRHGHGTPVDAPAVASPSAAGTMYVCPMHPQVRQPGPGTCPICGMALEPELPTESEQASLELADFSRCVWPSLSPTALVLLLAMRGHRTDPIPITTWTRLPVLRRPKTGRSPRPVLDPTFAVHAADERQKRFAATSPLDSVASTACSIDACPRGEQLMETYDVVFIGGGPGGYPGAIRSAQLGKNVACIERRARLGGTCLNIGCIPSKALLESSERFHAAQGEFAKHGIEFDGLRVNLAQLMKHKDQVVAGLGQGIDYLFKKHGVTRILGTAAIEAPDTVRVDLDAGGSEQIGARAIVIATGSVGAELPGVPVDEDRIVSSTGALSFPEVPEHLVVVGAGYVGLELGSVWRRLGAKVTVVEYLDRITPGMDAEVAGALEKSLQGQGFEFHLSRKVTGATVDGTGVILMTEASKGGAEETLRADRVLVSIGRRPHTDALGLEAVGVERDPKGYVRVDAHWRTNIEGIYAIGDVIGGPMLAHKASEEGVAVAEQLAGLPGHVNYAAIPSVIYTAPEVGSVGQTEEQLTAAGIAYKVGKFPFSASARARAKAQTEGFAKVLADATTDRILGVHIIGPEAGSLIHEAVVAMEFSGSADDVARSCHAHPTLPEALKEAAMAVNGWAIHI